MLKWTIEEVATRLAEAADTSRRLPRVGVQGYFNVWPAFAREAWETYPDGERAYRPLPPGPKAIDRMLETMRWVQWLDIEDRHLVWMRAKDLPWKRIARRFGCNRTSAWRRWQKALIDIALNLNAAAPLVRAGKALP